MTPAEAMLTFASLVAILTCATFLVCDVFRDYGLLGAGRVAG